MEWERRKRERETEAQREVRLIPTGTDPVPPNAFPEKEILFSWQAPFGLLQRGSNWTIVSPFVQQTEGTAGGSWDGRCSTRLLLIGIMCRARNAQDVVFRVLLRSFCSSWARSPPHTHRQHREVLMSFFVMSPYPFMCHLCAWHPSGIAKEHANDEAHRTPNAKREIFPIGFVQNETDRWGGTVLFFCAFSQCKPESRSLVWWLILPRLQI